MRRTTRRRDDRGSAVVEFVWLGLLLLVPLVWIVLSVFEVQSGSFAATTAARSAARAYALAPTDAAGATAANRAAREALADQGHADDPVTVVVTCRPYPDRCHSGTSIITARVTTRVDLPLVPDLLGDTRPTFRLEAEHTVPIGQYQEITGAG
ncbi:hypothetical protein GCM10023340_39360 [Nocardioides marinquilinus]|uniref:Pilus assembly protein n=1 Tax=Nocardioides marinquilinus TaxID=1210400 RepID=A0ABP9Q565_9ACTN